MTPTAPRVMASDSLPAYFRPGQQARLVPSSATNRNITNSMLPGLGKVQSGNGMTDNGLAPGENQTVVDFVRRRQVDQAKMRVASAQQKIAGEITAIKSQLDQSKATGRGMDPALATKLSRQLAHLQARQLSMAQRRTLNKAEANRLHQEPWLRRTLYRQVAQPLQKIAAPATPDPLIDEPAGISFQKNRQHILNVQRQISPVRSFAADKAGLVHGLGALPISTGKLAFLAVAGVLLVISRKRKR